MDKVWWMNRCSDHFDRSGARRCRVSDQVKIVWRAIPAIPHSLLPANLRRIAVCHEVPHPQFPISLNSFACSASANIAGQTEVPVVAVASNSALWDVFRLL